MADTLHRQPVASVALTVELTPQIRATTSLPPTSHSALRSGFAGYPTNPRWNTAKVMAWRLGRQWRDGLAAGSLVIRPEDGLLVAATELQPAPSPAQLATPAPTAPPSTVSRSRFGWALA